MLHRAWEAGVGTVLSIGIGDGPATMHRALDLSRQFASQPEMPRILATAGIHPHEASLADELALASLDQLLQEPEVIACGEIGLDYYYDHSPREEQKRVFLRQMEIAAARKRPIIIHCRPIKATSTAHESTAPRMTSAKGRPASIESRSMNTWAPGKRSCN